MVKGQEKHLWGDEWIDHRQLTDKLKELPQELAKLLKLRLSISIVLNAAEKLADKLRTDKILIKELLSVSGESCGMLSNGLIDGQLLEEMANFLDRKNLELKLKRELKLISASEDPFDLTRVNSGTEYEFIFEGWRPLGVLTHIAPKNVLTVGPLSVIEGLLMGNINILKTAEGDNLFAAKLLSALISADESGVIKNFIIVLNISSKEKSKLKQIFNHSDGVVVWGGEEAVSAVREMVPSTTRMITFGPKISFAFISKGKCKEEISIADEEWRGLTQDIVELEQQACSAPQVVYVECGNSEDANTIIGKNDNIKVVLNKIAERLAKELTSVTVPNLIPCLPRRMPSITEQAEITTVTEMHRLEELLGKGQLITGDNGDLGYRVLVDYSSDLKTSPLFRTIWVMPINSAAHLVEVLGPFRPYLQTVGVSCQSSELSRITQNLYYAGVTRITSFGQMLSSYAGEPHDGEYALTRYARRISLRSKVSTSGQTSMVLPNTLFLSNLDKKTDNNEKDSEAQKDILSKEAFQQQIVDDQYVQLVFKSGGSSGNPKVSTFTYEDYNWQMKVAADGLLAAGLNPYSDRIMNLFFSGALYGGFLSFFSILESIQAKHWPMTAYQDLKLVAKTIVDFKINTLLGMPSYLFHLFKEEYQLLHAYHGIKKIFYGGEHFYLPQQKFLQQEFGVELIRSASYGSVDAGPLGYQCKNSIGNIHHLNHKLQKLEIVDFSGNSIFPEKSTLPASPGRMLFTSLARRGPKLVRYEIGDLGRWVVGDCACGRTSPRFELLGRYGEVFKAGGNYLNYQRFMDIISENIYTTDWQMQIKLETSSETSSGVEVLKVIISPSPAEKVLAQINVRLIENYHDLHDPIQEGVLKLLVVGADSRDLTFTNGVGKLQKVIDQREMNYGL